LWHIAAETLRSIMSRAKADVHLTSIRPGEPD
jgi:hypothetical protein